VTAAWVVREHIRNGAALGNLGEDRRAAALDRAWPSWWSRCRSPARGAGRRWRTIDGRAVVVRFPWRLVGGGAMLVLLAAGLLAYRNHRAAHRPGRPVAIMSIASTDVCLGALSRRCGRDAT
jgi:hypothetical protein